MAKLAVALLAAGSSQRFGEADKLAVDFRGRPLAQHAADTLPLDICARAWLITGQVQPVWQAVGLAPVHNPNAAQGMGTSVALAARLADEADCDALVIALADMPFVPRAHFDDLIGALKRPCDIVGSTSGASHMPPVIFGSDFFATLISLSGDQGARELIAGSRAISCPPEWLIDIDTPQALQKYGQA